MFTKRECLSVSKWYVLSHWLAVFNWNMGLAAGIKVKVSVFQVFVDILGRLLCAKGTSEKAAEQKKTDQRMEEAAFMSAVPNHNSAANGRSGRPSHINPDQPPKLWTSEWNVLASVIDRLFFVLYVVGIILSMIFVFPR